MEKNNKIKIVDSIMGSGKTSAMIQTMRVETDKNYLFVTPFLDEIDRIIEKTDGKFKSPEYRSKFHTKLDDLHSLLECGENIATTHQLFLLANKRTEQLIVEGDYILILDESLDVLHLYNEDMKKNQSKLMGRDDCKFLIENGIISIDNQCKVKWIDTKTNQYDFAYSELKRLADRDMLRYINNNFYWEYPPDIFGWFHEIYVLTYLFERTVLDCYFQMHNFKYTKISAEKFNDGFRLCEYSDAKEQRKEYAELINLYDGKYNELGEKPNAFTINWLKSYKNKHKLDEIKKIMLNYKRSVGATSDSVMWTTSKQYGIYQELEKQKGFKYIHPLTEEEKHLPEREIKKLRQFVPCNARATNDYADRTTLMYLLDYRIRPELKYYFAAQNCELDENQIALNTLLQWIWRSAIRNKQPINVFIPSKRMRRLLCEWLDVAPF